MKARIFPKLWLSLHCDSISSYRVATVSSQLLETSGLWCAEDGCHLSSCRRHFCCWGWAPVAHVCFCFDSSAQLWVRARWLLQTASGILQENKTETSKCYICRHSHANVCLCRHVKHWICCIESEGFSWRPSNVRWRPQSVKLLLTEKFSSHSICGKHANHPFLSILCQACHMLWQSPSKCDPCLPCCLECYCALKFTIPSSLI